MACSAQDADADPHVTPEILDAFVHHLQGRVGSVTRASDHLQGSGGLPKSLRLDAILSGLGSLRPICAISHGRDPNIIASSPSERLLALGLELIRRGDTNIYLTELARARQVRDGLMIALLALCPIRLRNLAELCVGRQLRRVGDAWWIILEADETETGRPDERRVPRIIAAAIERWLGHWRSVFHPCDYSFWPSIKGGALAYTYVGHIVTETTRRELGVAVNPHLFRDCAVYTVAINAGDRMGIASGLLQHTDQRTVE